MLTIIVEKINTLIRLGPSCLSTLLGRGRMQCLVVVAWHSRRTLVWREGVAALVSVSLPC